MQSEGQGFGEQTESDRLHNPKLGDAKAGKQIEQGYQQQSPVHDG